MHHQDWTPVILKKKTPSSEIKTQVKTQKASISSTTNKPIWKLEKQIDDDTFSKPLNYVSRDDAQKIISGRVALKMTQKDLANKLNMQLKDIQDIESCKALENKLILSKIKKLLSIN